MVGVVIGLLGSGSFPSLIQALITRFGWRTSYMLLGLLVAVVMLPVGLLFFRRAPEDYGLLPDGAKPVSDQDAGAPVFVEENWTRSQAVHTWVFWIIGLGGACISMLGTGLQFHMVSIFEDASLSAEAAAAAFMTIAVAGAGVRLNRRCGCRRASDRRCAIRPRADPLSALRGACGADRHVADGAASYRCHVGAGLRCRDGDHQWFGDDRERGGMG